ncbi:MAG: glycosyltransferase [Thaumarchaeota archaeon]|jgi:glycosyltransferase involved in cell wall biosynthesis|nr:glycosyltransferase [Candidatus Geocrenenecus arthurdayi]
MCTIILTILNILSISILAYWIGVHYVEFRKLPKLIDENNNSTTKNVSIIIPVRNEGVKIRRCLDSILKQRGIVPQIIVVDDSSIDDTKNIIKEYSRKHPIEMIEASNRPPDTIGKGWPCYLGYKRAENDYLLFLDADTVLLDEKVLVNSIKTLESLKLDYLSLFPRFELAGISARFTYPLYINTVLLFERFSKVNRDNSNKCFLVGAFSLFKRRAYESAGSHLQVLSEILEDKILGEKIRALGFNFRLFNGSRIVETIVQAGIKDLWFSVIRFIAGLKEKSTVTTLLLLFYLMIFVIPLVSVFILSSYYAIVCILSMILSITLNSLELARNKHSIVYALGYPIAVFVLVTALIYLLASIYRGRIEFKWKDRTYTKP